MTNQIIAATMLQNLFNFWPEILLGIAIALTVSALLLLLKWQSVKTKAQIKQAEQAREELAQTRQELAQTRAKAQQELSATHQLLVQMQVQAQNDLEQARLQVNRQHTSARQELEQVLATASQEQQHLQTEIQTALQEQLENKWIPILEQIKDEQNQESRQLKANFECRIKHLANQYEQKLQQQQQLFEQSYTELQTALHSAQKASSAKSFFLSNMSHDIRTLMNTITGMSKLAGNHITEPSYIRNCLNKIYIASQQMLNLLNDILDMSRIECGKMELVNKPVRLPELIHNMMIISQEQAQDKELQLLINSINVQNECVIADQTRLMQILINIISNAIKYSGKDDLILVHISQGPSEKPDCGQFTFTCSDTGSGISPDFVDHIFDAFERDKTSVTSKMEGSGLGMAITKHIVEAMGGQITCRSVFRQGTTFEVILDLPIQKQNIVNKPISQLQGLPAIIVDDDINTYICAGKLLQEAGMHPEWAVFADEAINKTQKIYEKSGTCGLFLINQQLPDCSFEELTRQIREIAGPQPPIIILTPFSWNHIEKAAYKAGVSAFMEKPLFRSSFNESLRRIFCPAEEESTLPPTDFDFLGVRILLVEDGEMNMEIAETIIKETKAEVVKAWNGQEALTAIKSHAPGYFDLVLMDIQMPLLDGYETTKQIRNLNRSDAQKLPIVAMTANTFEEDIRKAQEAGMNDHLGKPIYPEDVFAIIAKYTKTRIKQLSESGSHIGGFANENQ